MRTVSLGEMAMIADPHVVRHERFLANVTPRCATLSIVVSTTFPWARWRIQYFLHNAPSLGIVARYTVFIATKPI